MSEPSNTSQLNKSKNCEGSVLDMQISPTERENSKILRFLHPRMENKSNMKIVWVLQTQAGSVSKIKINFRKHKLHICCRSRAVSFTTRAPTLLPPQRLISKSFAAKNFHPRVYQKHFLFIRQHATPTAQTRIILYERGTEGNERDSEGNEQPAQKSSQNVDTERFSFASHLTAS